LVIPLRLFAEEHALKENGVKLYVSPSFGLLSGQGEELVYRNGGSDDTVSQLLWHMNPLV
jgi:outer membrane protease